MKLNRRGAWIVRSVLIAVFALVGVVVFVWRSSTLHAQAQHTPVHMTTDWSNRHVVFSAPSSAEQAQKASSGSAVHAAANGEAECRVRAGEAMTNRAAVKSVFAESRFCAWCLRFAGCGTTQNSE